MPKIPEDEMLYVQQMLEQLQKSQEAARARQAAAAPPAEEEAQPPVQIDEWILQVSGHHSWLKLRVQVSVVVGALEQWPTSSPSGYPHLTLTNTHLQFVDLLKEHCGVDPDKPLECQEVRPLLLKWPAAAACRSCCASAQPRNRVPSLLLPAPCFRRAGGPGPPECGVHRNDTVACPA